MKTQFKDEIDKICDEKLRTAALDALEDVPNYFWKVPASSSGKYHPKCDLGDGGLVRHSIMVSRVAVDLLTAEIFLRDTDYNRDLVRITALFHDIMKQGTGNTGHTVFNHPILASDFLKEYLEDADVDKCSIEMICSGLSTHMGKWTTSSCMPDIVLDAPKTDFEKLIHTADYVASRKYIGGLEIWNEQKGN